MRGDAVSLPACHGRFERDCDSSDSDLIYGAVEEFPNVVPKEPLNRGGGKGLFDRGYRRLSSPLLHCPCLLTEPAASFFVRTSSRMEN